jgi:hypothetical protein
MLAPLCCAAEEPPIRVTARASTFAPADLHTKTIIARDGRNRTLAIIIEGDHYFRSSSEYLDGAQRQRVWDAWWRDLPCGEYVVRVELERFKGEGGPRTYERAQARFTVRGFECPELDEAPQ